MVRLLSVTRRPAVIVTFGAKFVKPDGRWITLDEPVPRSVTLSPIVIWPANVPAPRWMVLPLPAHSSAPAIVANGFACDASAHAGSDDAEADTYSCEPTACAVGVATSGTAIAAAPSTARRRAKRRALNI